MLRANRATGQTVNAVNLEQNRANIVGDRSDEEGRRCQTLIGLFDRCFRQTENTVLIKGGDEPIYLPAGSCDVQVENGAVSACHRVVFARGYPSSALHEIAHWCIAGHARRQQVDYGYWYEPDGRSAWQQAQFERVEVKPQALEWVLSTAAAWPFAISADNLSGEATDPARFKQAVLEQVKTYCRTGLPDRAQRFRQALVTYFDTDPKLQPEQFSAAFL